MKKESFILYTKYLEQIELLSMEQRGVLLTAIMNYESGLELPDMDGMTKMAFAFIKGQLEIDDKKYTEIVQKRSEAGKQGGRPSKTNDNSDMSGKQEKAKKANAFYGKQEKQEKAKKADNDSVYDNDNDNYGIYNCLLSYDKVLDIAKIECPVCYYRYQRKIDSGRLEYVNKLQQILEELQEQYSYDDLRKLFRHANNTYIISPNYQQLDMIWVLSNIVKVRAIEEKISDNDQQYCGKSVTTKTAEELDTCIINPEDI